MLKSITLAYAHSLQNVTFQPIESRFHVGDTVTSLRFGFLALEALYMLGSVYFTGYTLMKTTLCAVVFGLLYILYYKFLSDHLLAEGYIWRGLDIMHFSENEFKGVRVYSAGHVIVTTLTWIFRLIWAPLFWVITWFRIREKQI